MLASYGFFTKNRTPGRRYEDNPCSHHEKSKQKHTSDNFHCLYLELLLRAQLVAVATLLLAAVDGLDVQTSVALAADHLIAVRCAGEGGQGGLDEATAQAQDEVERGLFLDVVVRQGAAVFQLLSCEDQALLIGRDALLVLNLHLDIFDRVRGLDLEGDGLAGQCLYKHLHGELNVTPSTGNRPVLISFSLPIRSVRRWNEQYLSYVMM
jgi:hypothetical protein